MTHGVAAHGQCRGATRQREWQGPPAAAGVATAPADWHRVVCDGGGSELGRFLRARRARVTPEEVGLTAGAGLRRTPGLRREELATLAGISIDYYTRLERGKETHPSPSVVDALARALLLEERRARAPAQPRRPRRPHGLPEPPPRPAATVRPGVNCCWRACAPIPRTSSAAPWTCSPPTPAACGCSPASRTGRPSSATSRATSSSTPPPATLFHDWENQIRGCVARLRALAGTDPDAPDLAGLVDELLAQEPGLRPPVGALRRHGRTPRPQDLPPPRRRRPHPRLPVHAAGRHPRPPTGRVLRRTRHPRVRRDGPARPGRPTGTGSRPRPRPPKRPPD